MKGNNLSNLLKLQLLLTLVLILIVTCNTFFLFLLHKRIVTPSMYKICLPQNKGKGSFIEKVESGRGKGSEQSNILSSSRKININKATLDDLVRLPRIGLKTAQAIILYREKEGGFRTKEEIMNVTRIGQKTYDMIKDQICVDEKQ